MNSGEEKKLLYIGAFLFKTSFISSLRRLNIIFNSYKIAFVCHAEARSILAEFC